MSVKIHKYLLVSFLILSILIISSGIVNAATCYVFPTSCSKSLPESRYVLNQDYYAYPIEDVNSCATSVGTGICEISCCCIGTEKKDYTIGYCEGVDGITHEGYRVNDQECIDACNAGSDNRYNITGYVKMGGLIQKSNVHIFLDNTREANINPTTGKYNFSNLLVKGYSVTAKVFNPLTNTNCTATYNIENLIKHEEINLTVICNMQSVSGYIFDANYHIESDAIVKAYVNGVSIATNLTTISGFYNFTNMPSGANIDIRATNDQCTKNRPIAVADTNLKNINLTLDCGTYTVSGKVFAGAKAVSDAIVTANGQSGVTNNAGEYQISGLPQGNINVIATKLINEYNGLINSVTTCTANLEVTISGTDSTIDGKNIQLGPNTCCNVTTKTTACTHNRLDRTITKVGDGCAVEDTLVERDVWCDEELPPCNEICLGSWSKCEDGVAIQTCDDIGIFNDGKCNPAIRRPLEPISCNPGCGNGLLEPDLGEECDFSPDNPFRLSSGCNVTWVEEFKKSGHIITYKNIIDTYALQTIVCDFATCGCMPLPAGFDDINECTITPGTLEDFWIDSIIPGSSTITLKWYVPTCDKDDMNYVDHFELRVCKQNTMGGCDFIIIDNDVDSNSDTYTYTINPYIPNIKYIFKLTAVFDDHVIEENRIKNLTTDFETGSINCLIKNPNSWCEGNLKWTCTESNIASFKNCEEDDATCGFLDGVATCIPQAYCELCNGLFGIFGYQGYYVDTVNEKRVLCPALGNYGTRSRAPKSTNPDDYGQCYMDYTMTPIDKAYSCNTTISCYDYFSEESCVNDYCDKFSEHGVKQCEWSNLTRDGVLNTFNKGVCRPKESANQPQQCGLCNDAGFGKHNRLDYDNCTKNTCGLFGDCYFEPVYGKCINKDSMICGDYKLVSECNGGRDVSTDVTWLIEDTNIQKVSGTNVRTRSNDGDILNGIIGVCKWIADEDIASELNIFVENIFTDVESQCVRDADSITSYTEDIRPDCNIKYVNDKPISFTRQLEQNCERDYIAPNTTIINKSSYGLMMNLTDSVLIKDNQWPGLGQWDLGDSNLCRFESRADGYKCNYIQLWYCIVKKGTPDGCYPNNTLSVTEHPYTISLSDPKVIGLTEKDDGTDYTIYYFSEDPAKNLEEIKSFSFTADTKPPNVSVTLDMIPYSISDTVWLTNLTVKLTLKSLESDTVTCKFKVIPKSEEALISFDVYHKEYYNIPPVYDFSRDKLYEINDNLQTMYPEMIDGKYNYSLECTDASGNKLIKNVPFNITGNNLINSPTPYDQTYTSQSDAVSGGLVNISINTSVNGTCRYTNSYSYVNLHNFTGTEHPYSDGTFNKYHNATITIPQLTGTSKFISGIYRYRVVCNLSINDKTYDVYGTSMSNPVFAIDDIAPSTSIKIKDFNKIPYSELDYDYSGTDFTDRAQITLICNDSNALLIQGNDDYNFKCGESDAVYYCIANSTNNKCSNLEDYVAFTTPITFDYSNGVFKDKQKYGNQPNIFYYSTDMGGNSNIDHPLNTTLRIKNTRLNPPKITITLDNGTSIDIRETELEIGAAFFNITVNYTFENYVIMTNKTLRYFVQGYENGYIDSTLSEYDTIIYDGTADTPAYYVYKYRTNFLDNGRYKLITSATDDDNNINARNVTFTIKHPDNIITLISPKLGIGTTPLYDIIIHTTYDSECRYAFEDSGKGLKEKWFADPQNILPTQRYWPFSITHSTSHTIQYNDITMNEGLMYILCKIMDSSDDLESSFSEYKIHTGYNDVPPSIDISFIHGLQTEDLKDNTVTDPKSKFTTMYVVTDQESVCTITPDIGESLQIPTPPALFNGVYGLENYSDYDQYYTHHTFLLDYTFSNDNTYNYTVNCTNRAQLDNSSMTSVILRTQSDPPVMSIVPRVKYLTMQKYQVTCYGLCMEPFTDTYEYKTISIDESCDAETPYIEAPYSKIFEISETTRICVRGTDAWDRINTTSLDVIITPFNSPDSSMIIDHPYAYRDTIGGIRNRIYSPEANFTLYITTAEDSAKCKIIPWRIIDVTATNTAKDIYNAYEGYLFDNTSTGEVFDSNEHNTPITLHDKINEEDTREIICKLYSDLDTSDIYVSREVFLYWDNTVPVSNVNVEPKLINDWADRTDSRVQLELGVSSDDKSICYLNLSDSKIKITNKTNNVVITESFSKYTPTYELTNDDGELLLMDTSTNEEFEDIFDSYQNYREMIYSLPSELTQESSINLNVEYTFSVKCINRAKIYGVSTGYARYELERQINITMTSSNVSNNLNIPFNITTNINSKCNASIDNGLRKALDTKNNKTHSTVFTVNTRGIHIVNVACITPNELSIKGNNTYIVFVDTDPPSIISLNSSSLVSNCALNGFSVKGVMEDDAGIIGYVYRITKQGSIVSGPNFVASGNTFTFDYTNNTASNTVFVIYVTAVDVANKNSATKNITITTGNAISPCGNGCLESNLGEYCDGKELNGQTCKSLYAGTRYVGGNLRCNADCTYNYDYCDTGKGFCGNNKVEGPNSRGLYEQCDSSDGRVRGITCKDFGFQSGTLSCNNCIINTSKCTITSTQSSVPLSCNGMLLQPTEQCEGPYNTSTITCMSFGYASGTITCNTGGCMYDLSRCTMDSSQSPDSNTNNKCGNNITEGAEKCDGTSGLSTISCKSLGNFTGGTVSCNKNCTYNTAKCVYNVSTCANNRKDSTESDIDCGGTCTSCGLNKACSTNSDCASGKCSNTTKTCIMAPCNNTLFDADTETDVDCGKSCKTCDLNKNCSTNNDCKSRFCINNKCASDPCNNNLKDETESDIDCGGTCNSCDDGKNCNNNYDCSSGICDDNICINEDDVKNPIKLPLMLAGILMMLGGGGYVIYKTFIGKPPAGHGGQFTGGSKTQSGMPPVTPTGPVKLTPEQIDVMNRQHEASLKKRQVRTDERKSLLQKLGESGNDVKSISKEGTKIKLDEDEKNIIRAEIQRKGLKNYSNIHDEFVDLSELKGSKASGKKDAFDKLKSMNNTNIDKISRKIAEMSGTSQSDITPALNNTSTLSDTDALKLFGEMDRDTLMSGVFRDVLSELLASKKLTKENVSKILFEYMDKGLLTKRDVAKISSELNII